MNIKTNGVLTGYSLQIADTADGYIAEHYDYKEKEKINKIISLLESNFTKSIYRELKISELEPNQEQKMNKNLEKQFCTK